jgi:5-(carboxyamino)imidazole ribonucleotide mutase
MDNRIDVAVIAGSDSDLPLINETVKTLKSFGLAYSVNIASAHRTPGHLKQCIAGAQACGVKVFIAAAGMSAALAGVIASETVLPVIGIPLDGKNLSGMDSLFSVSQMPNGIPVACVAIGKAGAVNAAILAAQIISVSDDSLKEKLILHRKKTGETIVKKDLALQKDGIEAYIEGMKK